MEALRIVQKMVWGPWLLGLFLAVGVLCMVRLRGFLKEKIAAQEVRRKEIESNMLSALRKIDNELDNPESGWKQISSEDEKRFLITSQGTGSVIQDGDEVTIRLRYPGKDGKPEKFDELKTFVVTKDDTGFRGLRQGSSLIIACNGEKKLFEFVDILLVTKLKP